jgi:hypothetical protein
MLIYWPSWPKISAESEKRGFRFPSFSTTGVVEAGGASLHRGKR